MNVSKVVVNHSDIGNTLVPFETHGLQCMYGVL